MVFDPVWEYTVLGPEYVAHDLAGVERILNQHGKVIFQPYDAKESFSGFCKLALKQLNTLFVWDEPTLVLQGAQASIPELFNRHFRLGHKRGNGTLIVTHRITGDLPALLRMVHHFFVYWTKLSGDRETLTEYIGEAGAVYVANPPPYHFWHSGPGEGGGPGHEGPVAPVPRVPIPKKKLAKPSSP